MNALTDLARRGATTALFDCTKNPRHEKFVEPQTATFAFGPSTTIVLLCCSLPMCCRLTFAAPADAVEPRGRLRLGRAGFAV